eukprot:TRINITY_DN107772_c0_g1_i1.p1 TRINITY_DN107772_c0_g1~~TRINITY_DN107772_c0_g1_i1.p1  ORF type:complete len:207 (-),score=73.36 TRINITY_DN107772_c0_g1_i1:95-715(-)
MEPGLTAQDVDQLSQLLGECHLHEEQNALAQVMRPLAAGAGYGSSGPSAPASSTAAAAGPWADELMRRLQGCSSPEEGKAACAELMAAFHQQQSQPKELHEQLEQLQLQPQARQAPTEPDASARLQSLQGANRVIVRALRVMSDRQREQGSRCRQAEEMVVKLASELQARDEQLRASERAKALLESHLQLVLRKEDNFDMQPTCRA